MRGRFETKMRHTAPGPGAYPIVSQDKTTKYTTPPSFAFGSGVRDGKFGHQIPGPGQYTPFDPKPYDPEVRFRHSRPRRSWAEVERTRPWNVRAYVRKRRTAVYSSWKTRPQFESASNARTWGVQAKSR